LLKKIQILANDSGYFKEELAPVTIKFKGKELEIAADEHPKPATTKEGLAKLPSIFKKGGVVTAGTASVRIFFCHSNQEKLFVCVCRVFVMEQELFCWPVRKLAPNSI
jgi:Thiolase, N-terminal domain